MANIRPLNIVTSTGTRYRTHADVTSSLAIIRKSLIKDGIIDADAKFQIEGAVISPASEEHMKWADILQVRVRFIISPRQLISLLRYSCWGRRYKYIAVTPLHRVQIFMSTRPESGNSSGQQLTLVPLHRLCCPSPLRHFYTIDDVERDKYIKNGYGLEPTAGLILPGPSPAEDSIPLFRICLPNEHLYTTDFAEKERTTSQPGAKDEGIVG
ncbi:hypothetical protein BC629DRAFT_183809 [Irpex lacteus]|nr:hypothetical protein BC629DRAFT_183809 [Irpex lacteus]